MNHPLQHIVVCFDGTKKELTSSKQSNVPKLFAMLINEPDGDQKVLYYNGAGSKAPLHPFLSNPTTLDRMIKAASGQDVYHIVLLAYEELSKLCEEGTKVSVFGFSRGAYAARIFAGMLTTVGLPLRHNSNLVSSLFHSYRERKTVTISTIKPEVVFLGIWDTVETILFAYRSLPRISSNNDIKAIRHAVSVDERRVLYTPILYSALTDTRANVMERWFAGSHSDVGGRWVEGEEPLKRSPTPNLSNISLQWMISEFRENCSGIRFRNLPTMDESPDEIFGHHFNGKIHDSLGTLKGCGWWFFELIRFNFGRARRFVRCADCHWTVRHRRDADPSYKPQVDHEGTRCNCQWSMSPQ